MKFERVLYNKLKSMAKFRDLSMTCFVDQSKQIHNFLQTERVNQVEFKGVDQWVPLLTYLWFKYKDNSPAQKRVLGMQGPQGSGKSTICELISEFFRTFSDSNCETVSLDDFYLTFEQRQELGIRFRGPPGTHDFDLLSRFYEQFRTENDEGECPLTKVSKSKWDSPDSTRVGTTDREIAILN